MGFRYPGGDVATCTVLWIVIAAGAVWLGVTSGDFPWYFAACTLTGAAGAAMWFQVRAAGYIFGGINALFAVIGILGLFVMPFSWGHLARLAGALYASSTAILWAMNEH